MEQKEEAMWDRKYEKIERKTSKDKRQSWSTVEIKRDTCDM